MFRKSTLLALVAAATFGLSMLLTASADARGHGGGGGGGGFSRGGGHSMGRSIGGGMRGGIRGGAHRPGLGRGHVHRPNHHHRHAHHHHRHHKHWHHHHCRHHHHHCYPRVWYGTGVYAGYTSYTTPVAAAPVAAPVANRCTCLTKEYTPEGAVVFKDICTDEVASNPPAGPQGS